VHRMCSLPIEYVLNGDKDMGCEYARMYTCIYCVKTLVVKTLVVKTLVVKTLVVKTLVTAAETYLWAVCSGQGTCEMRSNVASSSHSAFGMPAYKAYMEGIHIRHTYKAYI